MPSDNSEVFLVNPSLQDRLMKEEYGKLTEEKVEQIYKEETKMDMKYFATNYTEIINDMNMQKVILHYEIKTMEDE